MSKRKGHIIRGLRILLTGVMLTLFAGDASAQFGFLDKLLGKDKEGTDSTEVEEKVKLPLESYFFDDSLRNRLLFSWEIRPGFNQIDTLMIDTLPNRFEVDYPFMRDDVGSAYLGNLGGASLPLNYFTRPAYQDFSFLNGYDAYLFRPDNVPFFNVKRPYTHLSWFMSGQTRNAEEQLRVTHAQNISPSTGINLHYYNRGTKGLYSSQKSKDKNLSLALSHTGKKYSIHGGYIYNMGEIRENGGVQYDADIIDTVYNPIANIPVRLRDATNLFKGNTFYVTQAYGIPLQRITDEDFSIADKSSIFIGHAFEYTHVHRKYTDTRDESMIDIRDDNGAPSGQTYNYYPNWYINPTQTVDSINEYKIDNKVFLQIQPWNRDGIIGTIDGGIGYAMHKYYYFTPDQFLHKSNGVRRNDTYLYGTVQGKLRRYLDWNAGINYHLAGYRSQDIRLDAQLRLSAYLTSRPITLTIKGFIEDRTPDFWMENYYSNHFRWSNHFSKETETRLEGELDIPSIGFEAGVWQSVVTDKLYYDWQALPAQNSGTISLTGIYVRKDFRLGPMRFNHRVLIQKSSDEDVVSLPLASAYISYFADFHLVRDVLRMQIGFDAWYNTEYYAQRYNPATMQFYNQNTANHPVSAPNGIEEAPVKVGNYPFMDFFVSAKWKRMRILVKFQHVNEDVFGTRTYFTLPHYPLNRRMLKLGFSWSFYD